MGYFPFFMDIEGRKGVIGRRRSCGGAQSGKAAGIRPETECDRGPVRRRTQGDRAQISISLLEKDYEAGDLEGAAFVIAATDDGVLNGEIADWCRARNTPVNVVDDREKCTFFFPALVKEGPLTVGDFHGWEVPCAAAYLRGRVERCLPEGIGRGHRSPGTASAGGGGNLRGTVRPGPGDGKNCSVTVFAGEGK